MYKENTLSILTNLLQRHQSSAAKYREALALVPDEQQSVHSFLLALAEYREDLADQLGRVLNKYPSSSVPKGSSSRPHIAEAWEKIRDAMLLDNQSRLLKQVYANEKALSEYYKLCLDQEEVPEDVKALLEEQHRKVLHQMRRSERMATVPQQK
jgi:hypothetical protein